MKACSVPMIHRTAPAKINLSLAVLGLRDDGFCEIESWVVQLDWSDRLSLTVGDGTTLRVTGEVEDVPTDPTNLVCRAAMELSSAAGCRPDVAITLAKEIPTGSGLGGGSSDAAATLLGLNTLWGLNWPIDRLLPIAARIGSDVPLFLAPGSAIIRGRGEVIERLTSPGTGAWRGWGVIIVPSYRLSTADVYKSWASKCNGGLTGRRPWKDIPRDSQSLMNKLYNDLEQAAFRVEPRLGGLHSAIDGFEGRKVRMTGSGSALFTLFDQQDEAHQWYDAIRSRMDPNVKGYVVATGEPIEL